MKTRPLAEVHAEQIITRLRRREGPLYEMAADLIDQLRQQVACALGVGDGSGQLFVHGDYNSIKAAQAIVEERDQLRQRVAEVERERDEAWLQAATWRDRANQDAMDAKRYHFLRDVGPADSAGYPTMLQWKLVTQDRYSGRLLFGDELDRAIDASGETT